MSEMQNDESKQAPHSESKSSVISNPFDVVTIVSSFVMLVLFLYTTLGRMFYPFDLEWMEGGMLVHGLRVMEGKQLYVEPSSEFIPFIYPPLYSWLLGVGGWIFGLDYSLGRGISLLSSLAATGALLAIGRMEKISWSICIAMGALFLSTYENSGTFMDLVRTDSLVVALLGWSLFFLRKESVFVSGILLCTAYLAKHNAAIFGIPMALWLWQNSTLRKTWEFVVSSALPALLMTGYVQYTSDGFFLKYLLEVPSVHPFVGSRFFWLAPYEMISALSVVIFFVFLFEIVTHEERQVMYKKHLCCIGLSLLGYLFHDELVLFLRSNFLSSFPVGQQKEVATSISSFPMTLGILCWLWINRVLFERYSLWLWCSLLAFLFCCIMRGHHGGYMNVLMPGFWFLALMIGFLLQRVHAHQKGYYFASIVIALQLLVGTWVPQKHIPTEKDVQQGENLIVEIQKEKGPLLAPFSPWYAYKAGHHPTFHVIALWDIDHSEGVLRPYVENIRKDISNHRWSSILVANETFNFGRKKYYPRKKQLSSSKRAPLPKIGWKARSKILFYPPEEQ
jgi:hypothetical protein